MRVISKFATSLGSLTYRVLNSLTGRGSSLPGKLALSIDSEVLSELSYEYDVFIVTGTNGKTLTTALCTQIAKQAYDTVISNSTGSNMAQGVVGVFLSHQSARRQDKRSAAVLEVDEGSLKNVVKYVNPKIIIHTNVFSDQVDRYSSPNEVLQMLMNAVHEAPEATLITNADSPLLAANQVPNPVINYGFAIGTDTTSHSGEDISCPVCGHPLSYEFITYGNLGKYSCPHCSFKRPDLDVSVDEINQLTLHSSSFTINDYQFTLHSAGIYNIYNALAAYTFGQALNVSNEQIDFAFNNMERIGGRQEVITIEDKQVYINLVKNPVGFDQVITLIGYEQEPSDLITIMNNNHADGVDMDWIWDTNLEQLANYPIDRIYSAGMQKETMLERLTQAQINQNPILILNNFEEILAMIKQSQHQKVNIIATYTAMNEIRQYLTQKGYISK